MKRIPLFIVAGLLLIAAALPGKSIQYELTEKSRMWIDGTSSIHDWTCEVNQVTGSIEMDEAALTVAKAVVTVPSTAVECKNGQMNKKAAAALKVGKHPAIRYTLKSAAVSQVRDGLQVEAVGRLELAGSSKDVKTSVLGVKLADGSYRFTGSLPVAMSDFAINPPTAMLGTIKTGDKVVIRFDLVAATTGLGSVSTSR